jgi:hypothetical protein
MWWDESLSHYRAAKPIPFILSNRIDLKSGLGQVPTVDNHPPLYFFVLHLVVRLAGDSEFAMRALSLACGVLVVPLLYQCGKRLYGADAGLLAALLGAVSPLYLWYQQEIRPYTMVTFLAVLSFYLLVQVLDGDPARTKAGTASRVAFYVLSIAAMLATHYLGFLLLAAHGAILLVAWPKNRRRLSWVILVTGLTAGAMLIWGFSALPKQAEIPGFGFLPFFTLLNDVFQQFTLGLYADVLWPLRWVAIALLAGSLIVLLRKGGTHRRYTVYLLLCFALPVVEIFAISFVRPAYMNIRHLMFASPFYYLLLAAGTAQARRAWVRLPFSAAWIGITAGMALSTVLYFGMVMDGKADHRGWGRYLSDRIRPGDLAIVNPGPVYDLYDYYVDTEAPWVALPIFTEPPENTLAFLQERVRQYERIWVAHSSTPGWANVGNILNEWLDEHATPIAFANFRSATTVLQVHGYRFGLPLLDAVPEDVSTLALNLDEQLHLHGWRSPMERVMSGHVLQLSLYWSAATSLDRDYRVTLALTDGAGFTSQKIDYAPVHGAYPTSSWSPAEIVRDDVDVPIPPGVPPGRYRLRISAYPADGNSPALAVRKLEDGQLLGLIVTIGEVEVTRPDRPPRTGELPVEYRSQRRYGPLSLVGHNYDGGGYQPGGVAVLDAYWRALRAPQRDLSFEIELLDEGDVVQASRTVEPVAGYLTTAWNKGEVVKGQYRFRLPVDTPPGQYTLALRPRSGEVWPWQQRRLALNTLTVAAPQGDRSFEVPPMQHTVGANLGDRVELLGIDLEKRAIRPGEAVSCTLYWRALQVMDQDYTVFNHLVAADGQTWGQWDNQPQRGALPTTRWVPGQVVVDPYRIPISENAPVGLLTLHVGMYDRQSMVRLPVYDENATVIGDHVDALQIEVTDR